MSTTQSAASFHSAVIRGGAVVLAGRECTEEDLWQVFDRELYQSMMDHGPFLREDFALMVVKVKWVVMYY